MQDIEVTTFINQQPTAPGNILSAFRITIFQTALHIEKLMKYGLSYYRYHGRLCFLNPRGGAVLLGLWKGAFLVDTKSWLEGVGKEVRHVRIKTLGDTDQAALQTLLQEAVLLNEMGKKRKS